VAVVKIEDGLPTGSCTCCRFSLSFGSGASEYVIAVSFSFHVDCLEWGFRVGGGAIFNNLDYDRSFYCLRSLTL